MNHWLERQNQQYTPATKVLRETPEDDETMRKVGLPPVVDDDTEILIMGTLPSDMSLAAGEYYANPSNDFWRIVGAGLGEHLEKLGYERKIACLKAHRIGLWDTFGNCVRPGSMDKDISGQELNDFGVLRQSAPKLRLVCFNGQSAAAADSALRALGYETRLLPSSSSANRKNQTQREQQWSEALR